MPATHDLIDPDYYNDMQLKIRRVLGDGKSDGFGWLGYGQTVLSSQVSTSDKVSVQQYSDLRYDIWNAYNHLNNALPSGSSQVNMLEVTERKKIRYMDPTSSTTPTMPVDKWGAFVNTIYANARNLAVAGQRRTVNHGSSFATWPNATYGDNWSDSVICIVQVQFSDLDESRHFFNSGSSIDITSTRTGGSSTNQNASWTSILTSAGTQKFSGNHPGTGAGPTFNGSNFYKTTSSFTNPFVDVVGSSPYSLNRYKIFARTPNQANPYLTGADTIEFRIEFIDDHEEQGGPPVGGPLNPGDGGFGPDVVDGQITVTVQTTEATGTLQPATSGNFNIATPTVNIGAVIEVS
jgi:hypothetical protein